MQVIKPYLHIQKLKQILLQIHNFICQSQCLHHRANLSPFQNNGQLNCVVGMRASIQSSAAVCINCQHVAVVLMFAYLFESKL